MNWLKYIRPKLSFKSALSLFLMLIMVASLASCAFYQYPPASSDGEETEEPLDSDLVVEPPRIGDVTSPSPVTDSVPPEEITGPDLPLRESMGDDFFEDAAFMGNSLMDGFRMFSGLTTCDYYAATSMSVVGATSTNCVALDNGSTGTVVDGLTQKPYGKIYILLGINEIGMNVDSFSELYAEMLDIIIEAQPDCDIYIMGITPVSYSKSSSSDSFNMTRIGLYNDALYQLAADKGCFYLDLVDALADDTGYLPAEETSDGVHFSANVYKTWVDYVRTHYV